MFYEKAADKEKHLFFQRYNPERYPKYNPLSHFHGSIEIFIVEYGAYKIYVEGEECVLKPGDVAFIDRFTLHNSRPVDPNTDFSVYVIVASSEYFSSIEWLRHSTLSMVTERKEGFDKILEMVKSVYQLRPWLDDDAKKGFIALTLGLLNSYVGAIPRKSERRSEMISGVIKHIGENYTEKITLEGLSKRFGYEKTHISSTLNKVLGMNLREYINRLRISRVKIEASSNPDEPLYKIAERCGFSSQTTFYRALKRYGGE